MVVITRTLIMPVKRCALVDIIQRKNANAVVSVIVRQLWDREPLLVYARSASTNTTHTDRCRGYMFFFFFLPEARYLFQLNACFTHLNTMTNDGWEIERKAAPGLDVVQVPSLTESQSQAFVWCHTATVNYRSTCP